MADAKMLNKAKAWARFARIPAAITPAVGKQLDIEVSDLVAAMKRAAPIDDHGNHPGELRDSIHAYDNTSRPLSKRIIADAKDKRGRYIGQWVENGHLIADRGITDFAKYHAAKKGGTVATARRIRGTTFVPGRPFFFPTYRARMKAMRRRLTSAANKAIRAAIKESNV